MLKTVLLFLGSLITLQSTAETISGRVQDKATREPIPFVNILIKGTYRGTMTDTLGIFKLEVAPLDTLVFSAVGYQSLEVALEQNIQSPVLIELSEKVQDISEVTVKPEVPCALALFKEIQKHKKENRQKLRQVDTYKTLETTTVYLAVDSSSMVIRSFGNLHDVTVEMNNQTLKFSPVYLAEQALAVSGDSTTVLHTKKDGIFPRLKQTLESVVLNNVVVDLDFYNEQVYIMERGFISPISTSALAHYKLYLNDSTVQDNHKFYHFSFAPKNKYDPLFTGHFTIEDSSFALSSIDVSIARTANLNFVNGFSGQVNYTKLPNGTWFYHRQNTAVNLSFSANKDSIPRYSSQRIDNIAKGNRLIQKTIQYSTSEKLDNIKVSEWNKQPEFVDNTPLPDAYSRVERLKQHEVVKGIDKIGGTVLTSYFNVGKIDVGPVFDVYSTNTIEGRRFSIPLRTSEQLFKQFSAGGFLGYGTRNQEIKYGANLIVQPLKTDKFILRFNYSNDYTVVSQDKFLRFIKYNPNNKGTGNFIALFTSWEENPYLKEEKNYEFRVEYNAPNDLHMEVSPYLMKSSSTPHVRFVRHGTDYDNYKNYGVLLDLRLAFGQPYDQFYFDRIYYISNIPVVHLSVDVGQTLLPGQKMNDAGLYTQFHGSIQGRITHGQLFMNYIVNAGYLFGDAPYDLLDQPVGSMSLGYSKDRFNLLHFASFAHNLYTNAHLHINGGGVLLNRVPGVKNLKLREIVSLKTHFGTLNQAYRPVFDLPAYYTNDNNRPYAEIGFGVTNILKVLRMEYVHLPGKSHFNHGYTYRNGIRFRMEMSF